MRIAVVLLVASGVVTGIVETAPVGVAMADSIGMPAGPNAYYYNTVFGEHPVVVGTVNNPQFSAPFRDVATTNVLGASKLTHDAYGVHFELDRAPVWGQPFTLMTTANPNDPVYRYIAESEPDFPSTGFDTPGCLNATDPSQWSGLSGLTPDRFSLSSTNPRYVHAVPTLTSESFVCQRGLGSRTFSARFGSGVDPLLNDTRGWAVFFVNGVSACKEIGSGCTNPQGRRVPLIIVFNGGLAPVAPTASFTATAQSPGAMRWVFDGSASSAANGATIASWNWTFSDGTTASGPTVTKSFSHSGSHTATLAITDSNGLTNSTTREFEVIPSLIVNSTVDSANATDAGEACDTGQRVGDEPECTLRAAIEAANAAPGTAQLPITFAISGGGVPTIALTSALPTITHSVSLDATTQAAGKVRVRPVGGGAADGFRVQAPSTSISGFVLGGFTGIAVRLIDAPDAIIVKNLIGLAADGTTPDPVRDGIVVERGSGIRIGGDQAGGNTISTSNNAVVVGAATTPSPAIEVTISHNRLGTNAAGTAAIGAGPAVGIFAIGEGTAPVGLTATANVIHSRSAAIDVVGAGLEGAVLSANLVGVSVNGSRLLGSSGAIRVDGAPGVAVTGNRVLTSAGAEVSIAGSAQLFINDDGSFGFNPPFLPPLDNPITGGRATVSGNTLGGQTPGDPPAASSGIVVWAGADGVTIDDNRSSGHLNVEVDLRGGSDHTITRNRLGALEVAGLTRSQAGIRAQETDGLRVGTDAHDGNTIGGTATGISIVGATSRRLVAPLVAGNRIGSATDGSRADVTDAGIYIESAHDVNIGPGNVVGSVGGPAVHLGGRVESATIAGLIIGGDATAVETRPVDVGITLGSGNLADSAQPTGVVIGPGVRIVGATDVGIESFATDVAVTGVTMGLFANGDTNPVHRLGLDVRRGVATVRSTTFAGGAAGAIQVGANGTLDLRESMVRDSGADGVFVATGGKADVRMTRFLTNGGEPIAGDGAPPAPVVQAAVRVVSGTQTRTWLVVHAPTAGTFEVFGNASCDGDPEAEQVLFSKVVVPGPQVITMLGRREFEGIRTAFTGLDSTTSKFSQCVRARSDFPDGDGDGIPDVVEAAGPNPSAANSARETQVPTDNGDWVTLQVAVGNLRNVTPIDDPSPSTRPDGLTLPSGLFSFEVSGIEPGSAADVDIILPQSDASTDYWKYGHPAVGEAPRWYRFGFNATTGLGAQRRTFDDAGEIHPGFTLHFIDGRTGDEDHLADGAIADPGGPGFGAGGDAVAPTISTTSLTLEGNTAGGFSGPLSGVTVEDETDATGSLVVSNNAPAVTPIGTTAVTWSVTDLSGNTATATQQVTVRDTTGPTLICPANVTVTSGSAVVLGTATAADLVDPHPTVTNDAPAPYPVGATLVTWRATDASGNQATCTQIATITAPSAMLRFDGFYAVGARRITATTFEAEGGKYVALSWRLRDARGSRLSDRTAIRSATLTVPGAAPVRIPVAVVLGVYIVVTPVKKAWAGKSITLTVTLSDGTVHSAEVRIRQSPKHDGPRHR